MTSPDAKLRIKLESMGCLGFVLEVSRALNGISGTGQDHVN